MSSPKIHSHPCNDFADRLVDLSDGELPAEERVTVEAHLATCASCREQLERLDTSLAALRTAVTAAPSIAVRRTRHLARTAIWIAVGSTAATILLTVGIASLLKTPTVGRGSPPNTLTTGQGFAGQGFEGQVSTEAALRQIALLEQQARLETSLALMPDDPWFADQRAANERLLTTYREAAAPPSEPSTSNPPSEDTL